MIVVELLYAAAFAGAAYFLIQQVIGLVQRDRAAEARKRTADAESRPLREEPPWGSATDQWDDR